MKTRRLQKLILIAILAGFVYQSAPFAPARVVEAQSAVEELARSVVALLRAQCIECHGADGLSGLDLRSRDAMLKGGAHGPAVVAGNAVESRLFKMIAGQIKPVMPLGAALSREQIELIRRWIDEGAVWPADVQPVAESASGKAVITEAHRNYWAFRSPVRPETPRVLRSDRVRNPIDAFVLARLEGNGMTISPEADRRTLLRRVTFDLTGLPPTPEEINAFLADRSTDAYEKVVARLLASPRYGERWAQHWLDVVRFAETNGFELDQDREGAWRFRDWVIDSLNEDKPYDRFLTEQIAGDQIAPDDFRMRTATGFLRAGPQHVVAGNQDLAVNRQEWLTEAVNGVGNAVLGMTIGCARCHDHKFDPIPQADYYRLQAFFASTDNADFRNPAKDQQEAHDAAVKAHKELLKPIKDDIAAIEKPYRDRLAAEKRAKLEAPYVAALAIEEKKRTPDEQRLAKDAMSMLQVKWDELVASLNPDDRERRAALRRRMHDIELHAPAPLPVALGVEDKISPTPKTFIFKGGDPHVPAEEVEPRFPSVLTAPDAPAVRDEKRRLALARWLVRPDHPLTSRVMMNRLWHHYFGRGIVATPNDFGRNGGRPSHPELLDWLSSEFVAGGWKLKRMHEMIVLSSVYRQSSISAAEASKAVQGDPENILLWRQNRKRLDAEALRDSILAVSGRLTEKTGGPSVRVPLDPEVYDTIFTEFEPDNLWPVTPDAREHTRRSLYLLRKRNVRLPMFVAFDAPDWMSSCAARSASVHALQALTMLNSDFMFNESRALAGRIAAETSGNRAAMISRLYELSFGRRPKPAEIRLTEEFLRSQTAIIRARISNGEPIAAPEGAKLNIERANAAAWVDLCLATLNRNEFIYIR
ncbi:MAG: DUF1549 domain-containing protein [Acidobacteria bacterium]|nr:DUF1549 domain-containing protein [Acidobacteriota bacterium]